MKANSNNRTVLLIFHWASRVCSGPFNSHETAIFMWGRDQKHYQVFRLVENLPIDVDGMDEALSKIV